MIEVKYLDIPPEIEEKLSFTCENIGENASAEKLTFLEKEPLWATTEYFGWPLDGSRRLLKETESTTLWSRDFSATESGYLGASVLGGAVLNSRSTAVKDGPFLEVVVSEPVTVPGITFEFSPEEDRWCSTVELTVYRGEEMVEKQTLHPDNPRWCYALAESFDRLTVRLLETSVPGCYAKLNRLYLGRVLVYSHGELESVKLVNEADPTLSELTVDTMTVELRDLQERQLLPRKDQRIELYRDGRLLVSYGIESFSRQEKNRYTLRCRSAVGQLEDTFLGGIYENAPIESVLEQILEGLEVQVEECLKDVRISGYLPVCTRRQALQQVAFAAGALVSTRGTRGILLRGIARQVDGSFQTQMLFRDGVVQTDSGVSRLEAVAHKYTPTQTRETLVDGEHFSGENVLLTFDTPHHSYTITGGRITEQGANHIRLTANGAVTVTACTYSHTTVRHIRDLASRGAFSADRIEKVEAATLIHSGNVQALLDRLDGVYALRQTLTQTVVVNGQFAGQRVALTDPFGDMLKGYITEMESNLTPGGQTARITLLGQQASPETEVRYAGMFYAGDQEVAL